MNVLDFSVSAGGSATWGDVPDRGVFRANDPAHTLTYIRIGSEAKSVDAGSNESFSPASNEYPVFLPKFARLEVSF